MSIALPLVDLTSAVIGTTGVVSFQNAGIGIGGADSNPSFLKNPPHLRVFNDSKFSLYIQFIQSSSSDHLRPGAWRTYELSPGEAGFHWTVESIMSVNAPIEELTSTYYFPNESVPIDDVLGNSPVGGGVTTSNSQTLSNEGNPAGTLVIDVGDSVFAQLMTLFSDGSSTWAVDQTGTKHQVIKIQTSGNPLQIGQNGDTTEVLGTLLVDQNMDVGTVNEITGTNSWAAVTGTGGTMNTRIQSGGTINFQTPAGTSIASIASNGLQLASNQRVRWEAGADTLRQTHSFTGTGTGTYSHGCAAAPFWVGAIVSQSGSATQGFDTITSTQVHITLGSSLNFSALCLVG